MATGGCDPMLSPRPKREPDTFDAREGLIGSAMLEFVPCGTNAGVPPPRTGIEGFG